jgi:hypothetical protein
MKKLPGVNLSEPVILTPYAFETEEGKPLKGISVYQDENKIKNFFWDDVEGKVINGMLKPDLDVDEKWDKDEWKYFYAKVRKFLIKHTTDNIIPKVNGLQDLLTNMELLPQEKLDELLEEEEINVDNIPF